MNLSRQKYRPMIVETTEVGISEGSAEEATVELRMSTRERRQIVVGEGMMILARSVRIEQEEVLCSKDL